LIERQAAGVEVGCGSGYYSEVLTALLLDDRRRAIALL
jgi:protein-L-isoaspartate O-methyltransferase